MNLYKITSLLLCLLYVSALAQTVVVPSSNAGANNANNSLKRKPLGSYYGYERSAFIYTQTELAHPGTITINSIAFYCDTINSLIATNTPVKVYLKETIDTVFAASSVLSNEINGATLVFNGTIPASSFSKNNWTAINFTTNFTLTSTSHLKIIIETNAGATGNEGILSKGFRYNTVGSNRFQYWQQDNFSPSGTGALDTLRPNITINFTASTPCAGLPLAGTIVASDTAVCANAIANFYLQGNTSGNGITYTWQISTDITNWTTIPANNIPNLMLSIDSLYYIKATVSCATQSSTTPIVTINKLLPIYCYCYTTLGGNCAGYSIDSLAIDSTTFQASLNGCENNVQPHYSKYAAIGNYTTTLNVAHAYTMAVRQTGNNTTSLWIDYDHDGLFELNEWVRLTTTSITNGVQTKVFTIPVTAFNGLTGMRVRSRAAGFTNDSTNACTTFSSGETEDFLIRIAGGLTIGSNEINTPNISSNVYPNPTTGHFYFESLDLHGTIDFDVLDLVGTKIYHGNLLHSAISEFNLQLESGTYFFIATDTKGLRAIKKIVVSR